jgi:ribosomal protein S12 methylthiotransferase
VLADEPRIVKYLDMPIQHGSDAVLTRMRRPERNASIRATVARIREAVPGIALRTTCIVGFPGETEDDVGQLLDLLEEVQFERVGIFAYSEQPGTRAAELPDDVPAPVKRERLERVSERQRLVTGERYEGRIGMTAHAIVDRATRLSVDGDDAWRGGGTGAAGLAGRGGSQARLSWQADDIDGITYLDRDLEPGTIVEVRVAEVVDDYDFRVNVERVVSRGAARSEHLTRRPLPMASAAASAGAPATAAAGVTAVGSFGR